MRSIIINHLPYRDSVFYPGTNLMGDLSFPETFCSLIQKYTDTGPTSQSTDRLTPGAWQDSHWSYRYDSSLKKRPTAEAGIEPRSTAIEAGAFTTRPRRLRPSVRSMIIDHLPYRDSVFYPGRNLMGDLSFLETLCSLIQKYNIEQSPPSPSALSPEQKHNNPSSPKQKLYSR